MMILTASKRFNPNRFTMLAIFRDPGWLRPQYGQAGSSALMSLRQRGQSNEFLSL
jgi:hypothetical protein